jgi:hypothetical protein
MEGYQTWRDLLAKLIKEPREKRRLTKAIGVDAATLRSWAMNETTPRPVHLARLLQAVPRHRMLLRSLIAEEFEEFDPELIDAPDTGISEAFSASLLDLHTSAPDEARFWSICTAVLSEAVRQLDPDQSGISLSVVQCMASAQDKSVRYLRECVALGTDPWLDQMEFRTRFLGAESLAGYAITSGQPHMLSHVGEEQRPPCSVPEHAVSAAAFPILHANRVAGCLVAVSTQPDYFLSPARCERMQNYAALLMLAFAPEHFYERERIALQVMPSLQVQQPYLSTLPQRILATLKTAFNVNHPLSYPEAQQYVWGQVAEELVRLQSPQW